MWLLYLPSYFDSCPPRLVCSLPLSHLIQHYPLLHPSHLNVGVAHVGHCALSPGVRLDAQAVLKGAIQGDVMHVDVADAHELAVPP